MARLLPQACGCSSGCTRLQAQACSCMRSIRSTCTRVLIHIMQGQITVEKASTQVPGTDRCNESGQESRGIFAPGSPESAGLFSRTADGAPLRAIEARVCSPCTPRPPASATRSPAGSQIAKTAWAELHLTLRPRRPRRRDRDPTLTNPKPEPEEIRP